MEVVEFAGYTEREKAEIAKKYLIPRQLEENGLAGQGRDVHRRRRHGDRDRNYTRESGVRQLEREIGAVARKVARRIAGGDEHTIIERRRDRRRRGARTARPAEGAPREAPATSNEVGVATGMYYTPMGGDIMFVEASIRRSRRRRAGGRCDAGGGGRRVAHPHRPARRRDEGVGARRVHVRDEATPSELGIPRATARRDRGAHPRARRRDPEGRPVGRRRDRHGAGERDERAARCAATSR